MGESRAGHQAGLRSPLGAVVTLWERLPEGCPESLISTWGPAEGGRAPSRAFGGQGLDRMWARDRRGQGQMWAREALDPRTRPSPGAGARGRGVGGFSRTPAGMLGVRAGLAPLDSWGPRPRRGEAGGRILCEGPGPHLARPGASSALWSCDPRSLFPPGQLQVPPGLVPGPPDSWTGRAPSQGHLSLALRLQGRPGRRAGASSLTPPFLPTGRARPTRREWHSRLPGLPGPERSEGTVWVRSALAGAQLTG